MRFSSMQLATLAASIPLALAQDVCSQAPTQYVTVTNRVTVTATASASRVPIQAVDVGLGGEKEKESCGLTVTTTTTQRHYVTVTAQAHTTDVIRQPWLPQVSNYHSSIVPANQGPGGDGEEEEGEEEEEENDDELECDTTTSAPTLPTATGPKYWNSSSVSLTVLPSGTGAPIVLPPVSSTSETTANVPVVTPTASSSAADETTVVLVETATVVPVPVGSQAPAPSPSPAPAQTENTSGAVLGSAVTGDASFYGGNLAGGTCSFSGYTLPAGVFGTAISKANWDNSNVCGQCVEVTGPKGNTITAMVVDQCPECPKNKLDLFENAFATLEDKSKGIISVKWKPVSCPVSGSISLRNKEGTSKSWYSVQVRNSAVPISKVEVSGDGGKTWIATTRMEYNFFQAASGPGSDSVTVKVTSSTGKTITVSSVSVAGSAVTAGTGNF